MVVYPEVISLDTLMCSSQPSFIIQQMPPGGHWWANGAGIIDSSTGLFDPSVALKILNLCILTTQLDVLIPFESLYILLKQLVSLV